MFKIYVMRVFSVFLLFSLFTLLSCNDGDIITVSLDFDKNLDAMRQKHNLEMFSFPTELLQDSDYYDFVHHTQQGREKLSKLMGLWIADYFQAATASPSDTGSAEPK